MHYTYWFISSNIYQYPDFGAESCIILLVMCEVTHSILIFIYLTGFTSVAHNDIDVIIDIVIKLTIPNIVYNSTNISIKL